MRVTMDAAGRLVIPKKIRDQAGLRPGTPLAISCQDGRIEIEAAPIKVRLERRGHLLVAVPEEDVPTVTAEEFELIREQMLLERAGLLSRP